MRGVDELWFLFNFFVTELNLEGRMDFFRAKLEKSGPKIDR